MGYSINESGFSFTVKPVSDSLDRANGEWPCWTMHVDDIIRDEQTTVTVILSVTWFHRIRNPFLYESETEFRQSNAFVMRDVSTVRVIGDALPSHRDELLREINLMKQIGYHANVVRLVGACTVCDPIALIMEYMPYGNLQTFLQYVTPFCIKLFKENENADQLYRPTDDIKSTPLSCEHGRNHG